MHIDSSSADLEMTLRGHSHNNAISGHHGATDRESAAFKRSGLGTQLKATLRRQLIQKRRKWISSLLELSLPVVFALGLVAISLVSPRETVPSRDYIGASGAWDFAKELRTSILCYEPQTNDSGVLLELLESCKPLFERPPPFCFEVSDEVALSGVCLKVPLSTAIGFISSVLNNEQDVIIPSFDDYVLFKWTANSLLGSSGSIFSGGLSSARQAGKLYVMPPTGAGPAFVEYLDRTFPLFKYVFGGYFESRAHYVPFVKSLQNEGKVWAVLGIDDLQPSKKVLDYTLAMNATAQPQIFETKRLVDVASSGLGNRQYAKSTASGALTLQKTINDYFMFSVLGLDVSEGESDFFGLNSSQIAVAPMPVPSYVRNQFLEIGSSMGPLLLVLAFLYPVSQLSKRLVEEKEQRLREGTMIMGLSKAAFFASWLSVYYAQMLAVSVIIAIIIKIGVAPQSDFFIIWVAYALFSFTTVNLSALLSTFFNKAKIAALCVPLLYFVFSIPAFAIPESAGSFPALILGFLCPIPFSVALKLVFKHEVNKGLGWNYAASLSEEPYSYAACLVLLVFDFFLYIGLMIYFDNILPKDWGTRLHPCYCFCSCCNRNMSHQNHDHDHGDDEGRKNFCGVAAVALDACDNACNHMMLGAGKTERCIQDYPYPNRDCSVHIRGLRKEFEGPSGVKGKSVVAVDGMELRMFPNAITVLLGHNGAGKTTVLNMMTGMLSPTGGDVTIYGNNILTNMQAIRRDIGFCPQHNILWNDLTCFEHLQYFARLKGVDNSSEVDAESTEMLTKVDLLDKRDVLSCNLSGGQKRKLSVAIAFMGRARLVLLDEPTAGMDVAARRHTWEVLKEMSRGRTILLTTHFMDEADLLGSRIAIMSKGSLHSYGTSTYLKNKLGTGYSMRLTTCCSAGVHHKNNNTADPERILEQIQTMIPNAFVREAKGQEVSIGLPNEDVSRFPQVIRMMESAEVRSRLQIASLSMSACGLEEVFLAIARDEEKDRIGTYSEDVQSLNAVATERTAFVGNGDNTVEEGAVPADLSLLERVYHKAQQHGVTPTPLHSQHQFSRQLRAMVLKRVRHGRRDRCAICLQIIAPFLCILLAMCLTKIDTDSEPTAVFYSNTPYEDSLHLMVTLNRCNGLARFVDRDFVSAESVMLNSTSEFSSYLLQTSNSRSGDVLRMVSFSCNTAATAAEEDAHNASNAALSVIFANASGLIAAPQGLTQFYSAKLRSETGGSLEAGLNVRQWPFPNTDRQDTELESISATMLALFILIPFTFIPSAFVAYVVRERECKSKHLQFVSGASYTAYWAGNFIFDLASYTVTALMSFALFALFDQQWAVGTSDAALGIFVLFMLYGLSGIGFAYLASFLFNSHSSAQTVIMMVNFLVGFVLVLLMYFLRNLESTRGVADVVVFFLRVVPPFALGDGLFLMVMSDALVPVRGSRSVFSFEVAGYDMLFMGIVAVAFLSATMFLDNPSRERQGSMLSFSSGRSAVPLSGGEDEDVAHERKEIESGRRADDVVQVQDLCREFDLGGGRKKVAVENITFGVKRGEVFGFLGTNGAGKTTTMSMLTTEIVPTCGRGRVGGYDIVRESAMTRQLIGYCPQFDAIMDLLTPIEHLLLFAAVRGIPEEDTADAIEALIASCALQKYRDVPAGQLSGGNKRKLSVAMALIGGPSIVFLDEPSAGMDPHARRQMWDVIICVAKHSSVVLTTHHLEEVDVLAHRVGIMDAGLMKCLGSLEHLKMKFGKGFELSLQLRPNGFDDATRFVSARYPSAVLVEAHQQRILYTLPFDSTDLAGLFEAMHLATEDPAVGITDYTVQQTSLEQVFLRISQRENTVAIDANNEDHLTLAKK